MKLNSIGGGDLVRALGKLQPQDEATQDAIAGALGFDLAVPIESPVDSNKTKRGVRTRKTQVRPEQHRGPSIQQTLPAGIREQRFELIPEKGKAAKAPMRMLAPESSAPLPDSGPEDVTPLLPWEPLFNPQWSRAIVSTMAKIRTRAGPPDIETLVTAAAERRPMFSLPATVLETASGADVLLDIGDSMTIFGRDQADLLQLTQRVLGSGCVSVYRFLGSPIRGVTTYFSLEPQAYQPPPEGWPVVLLTDLGIGAGMAAPTTQEWRSFADIVRSAGCHLVALVPYPVARWPAGISSYMDVIQWDRRTSVRTIKRAIRHAERSCL
jgi:hypothetical protein